MTVYKVGKAVFELETDEGIMYMVCDGDCNEQPEITLIDDWRTRWLEIRIPHKYVCLTKNQPDDMSIIDGLTYDMYEDFDKLINYLT